ncbi:DUF2188 domain-containing protein [Saccharopolyspora phatthalungensis]|uniref:DUF2188 domain-containing protein n=1 Tax=Saccharopolyspora phatthalungensis TaxID=664693 RepID=UPI00161C053E|nr:DUF2188 domain-containing protein [Saccharopolyspora phatthalungensis]
MATRHVAPHPDGGWQVTDPVGHDSPGHTTTQEEAVATAHEQLVRDGGGELVIHGTDGKVRDKRTVPPGHDPYPPPG